MKEYNEVRSEYQGWKAQNPDKDIDLATYAKLMDEYTQTPGERGQAYNDNKIKQLNAGIDRFFQPVADTFAPLGKLIDTGVGELGFDSRGAAEAGLRELPRAAAEFIPFAGWAGKASRLAKVGQLAGQAAGMASAGANAYSDTDNVAAGIVGAAGLPLTAGAAQLGEKLAAKYLTRGSAEALAKSVPNPTREALGVFTGGNVGAGLAGEAQRQAMISATGEGDRDPFTAENVVSNIVGTLPEVVAKTGPELVRGRGVEMVNKMRADKIDTYLEPMRQRQEQQGYETVDNELGSIVDNAPFREEIVGGATVRKNNDFIEDGTNFNLREVWEDNSPFSQPRSYRDEIAAQADKLAMEFKHQVGEASPRFTDANEAEGPLIKSEELVKKPTADLSDPVHLAKFVKDVNQTLRDQYDAARAIEMTSERDIRLAANLRKTLGVGQDIVETPEPLQRKEFDAFNPKALEDLQAEGRVPMITPEFLKERFEHHFENGITFTDQEAYHGMVQSVKNVLIDMAQQANRQKAFEIQRRAELQSTAGKQTPEQRAEIYVANLKQLPKEVQEQVFAQRLKWEQKENQYGSERDQIGHHEEIVNQAVANWNKETGMTTVKFQSEVPGGYVDATGKQRKYRTVEKFLPIEEAVLLEPKRRLTSKKAKTERRAVSLEALTEEGAAKERESLMQRGDLELEETQGLLTETDAQKVKGGKVEPSVRVGLETESKPINEGESNSFYESNKGKDSVENVREALREIDEEGRTGKVWGKYREVFTDSRGALKLEAEKRAFFPMAVAALGGDRQALLRFGQAKAGRAVSLEEAGRLVNDYWNKGGFKEKFYAKLRKDAGALDDGMVKSLIYNEIEGDSRVTTVEEFNAGIKTHFEAHFRKQAGLSPELVDHFTAISLKAANIFGETNAKFANLEFLDPIAQVAIVKEVSEELGTLGMYGRAGYVLPKNPLISVAVGHLARNKDFQGIANFRTVATLVHEMLHDVQYKVANGLKSPNHDVQVRAKAYENMWLHASSISKEDRFNMLVNLVDTVIPPKLTRNHANDLIPNMEGWLKYGSETPAEFISKYGEIYYMGLVTGGEKIDNVISAMRWEPPDVQNFMRAVYRDVSNFAGGLAELAKNPIYRQMNGLKALSGNADVQVKGILKMQENLNKLIRPDVELLKAQKTVAQVMSFLSPGTAGALAGIKPTTPTTQQGGKPPKAPATPVQIAQGALVGSALAGSGDVTKMNWWQKTFMPFVQAAARTGNKVATQVASTLIDNTHVKLRLNHQMLDPIMVRDGKGKLTVDPTGLVKEVYKSDTNQPSRAHRAVNNLSMKMQELGDAGKFVAKVVPDPTTGRMNTVFDQLVASEPTLAAAYRSELSILNPKERGQVQGAMNQMLEVYRNSAEVLWKSQVDHTGAQAARFMQVAGVTDANDALQRGMLLMNGMANNDMTAVKQSINGLDPKLAQSLIEFATDLNVPLKTLRDLIDNRPFFMSEQRQGTHMLYSVNNKGENESHGADSEKHARTIINELKARGNTGFKIVDKKAEYGDFAGHLPEKYAEQFAELENAAAKRVMARLATMFPPPIIAALGTMFQPGKAAMTQATAIGVKKNLTKRKLVGGRQDLDYMRGMKDYVTGLATSVANRATKDRVGVLLEDGSMAQVPDFKPFAETQLENLLRPGNEYVNKTRTMMSAYYLAANLGSMIIEGTQNFVTLVPHLIKNGDNISQAYGRLGKAIAQLPEMKESPEFNASARRGGMPGAKAEDQLAHWYRRFRDENPEGSNAFDDLEINEDKTSIFAGKNKHGNFEDISTTKILVNGVYQLSKFGMRAYGKVSNWNSKAAFIAGFKQAQEKGMQGADAYEYAKQSVYTTSFGGGKANQPGYVAQFAKATPLIGLVHTLQQYGMGISSMMGTYAKDAIMGQKGMTPDQKVQARKAFGTMFTTQMALSGALGLPFVGAAMAILEKQFGIQAGAAVREGLASLAGDDEELGFMLGDAAMNGVASQVLGMDVASRTGVGNLVGTSSYSGFNLKDLLGPAPSLVENLFSASQQAQDGEPIKVIQTLMPQTFKNSLQMFDTYKKFDKVQFMDKSNNMIMEPTVMESLKYAVGFKPTRLRQYQAANNMQIIANEINSRERNRDLDKLAVALIKDDSAPLVEYVQEARANDPGLDPRTIVNSVLDKAIDMSTPRDLLANRGADGKLIGATMGKPLNRRSEVQRLEMKEAALAKLGYPFGIRPASRQQRLRAIKVDELINQGLTRAEAIRLVDEKSYRQQALMAQWDQPIQEGEDAQMMGGAVGL